MTTHPQEATERSSHAVVSRRRLLALAGAGTIAGMTAATAIDAGTRPAHAATAVPGEDEPGQGPTPTFAVVTDTHANADQPARLDLLARVFDSIAERDPSFVLNCGDVADYGGEAAYGAYLETIPDSLQDRMRHVPGNHDVRWDVNAAQLYRELFGPAPYSFDMSGLHVVGLDPTQLLQEPGNFGPGHLDWIARDLRDAAPSVLFLHFPLGADHYYLNDQDALFATVADLPVRAIFAGHVHRETVYRFNGFTQVTGSASRNEAVYYWVERHVDDGHPVLRVTSVRVDAAGTETAEEMTTIPLSGNGEGRLLRPRRVVIDRSGGPAVTVRVDAGRDATPAGVHAQVYPQHVFGGRSAGSWIDLAATGRSRWWSGEVAVADLPPGMHRMQLRVVGGDGATYETTQRFEIPRIDSTPHSRWTVELAGSIQGALAERDGVVLAASTGGVVAAVDAARGRTEWQRELGPVYRAAAFTDDGSTVYLPSSDHRLYALDAQSGADRWSLDVGDPVLSAPQVTAIDGTETVIFSAGTTLHAVAAADGTQIWAADLRGFFAGRVACDGERVYAGSGDGYAHAFDAGTGERLWTFNTTTRQDTYGRLLYGPWDDTVELLPEGLVLFATVTTTFAVDRASGEERWRVAAGCMYPASRLIDDGALLLADEWGAFHLVDPATGVAAWRTELGARTLNAGPVVAGGTAWTVATTGLMAGVDLATGDMVHQLQVGPANTFSTPVVVDGTFVFGDQDGMLHGIDLP
ncbi:outer membrane protein assembly factor BamB family protein [Phytoactinopolyspora halotolerans]|uniref:PQQ-binding-like beta-propeller repeat protein n=1 Tax=Phytoactinopolyspora halotolerans TaxID=1981512 RepID=A0A6L9S8B2_9ACTN|nr:PQQ-binding-like beta-propeller repeat protein [Phytoactinopolyspora halotolerans]NEE00768.1 PQQ-binding-like beta-propeller repeat protein [Phytoactinopolyspora halotolerans]